MTGYRVDPDELVHGDAVLGAAALHGRHAAAELAAAARELLDGRWEGAAAAAFRVGWQQWVAGVASMLDALDAMAIVLGRAAAGYSETDDSVRTSLARVSR
jgi:WXG100 family type VII secretion target